MAGFLFFNYNFDMMKQMTPQDTLYYHDGPMILTLSDGENIWLASCIGEEGAALRYRAAKVSRAEAQACISNKMSLYGALAGKMSREVRLVAQDWFLTDTPEQPYPETELPGIGLGTDYRLGPLPDSLPADDEVSHV